MISQTDPCRSIIHDKNKKKAKKQKQFFFSSERGTQKLNPKLDKKKKRKKEVYGGLQASCSKIQFNNNKKKQVLDCVIQEQVVVRILDNVLILFKEEGPCPCPCPPPPLLLLLVGLLPSCCTQTVVV